VCSCTVSKCTRMQPPSAHSSASKHRLHVRPSTVSKYTRASSPSSTTLSKRPRLTNGSARGGRGSTVRQQSFISAANRERSITEQRAAVKAEWEGKRLSKYYGYRNGKAGSRRPIPMKSKKSLASRYYQLQCGYAPTATYLKRFGLRDDD
jgi:hypothetical protein